MSGDLRLGASAAAAWVSAIVAVGAPDLVAWFCVVGWLAAAGLALATMQLSRRQGRHAGGRRRSSRPWRWLGRGVVPGAALAVAASALVCTAVFGIGHLRHPTGITGEGGSRGGTAELVVTGLPEPASGGFFDEAASQASWLEPGRTAPPSTPQRIMVEADLTSFGFGPRTLAAHAPVLLFATVPDPASIRIGSTLTARGTLTALTPGDSREFLFFARGSPSVTAAPPWLTAWADTVRDGFRATTRDLPGDGRELLTGLAIGDDRHVSDELQESMTVSGLTHLTAVSGANCAIVVAAVMLVGGALGLGRRIRILVSIGVLALFVVLVTPEPSVIRAATMAVIVLVVTAIGRPSAGLPPLFLSVVVLLALDPWLSRSAGFALSVLATAGLLLFTRPLAALASRIMPRALALTIAVPVAAQLACQPVLFLLAPQLTPYTLPANVLAEPAAAAVSVLGLIVCVLGVAAPGLAPLAAWLPWLPSAWIGAVARFFAGMPFAVVPLSDSLTAAGAAVVLVGLLVFWIVAGRRHPRVTAVTAGAAALVTIVSVGSGLGGLIARDAAIPGDWQIAACDIGQGDAVLVRDGATTALIDVGPDPEPLEGCLDRLHIQRIDLLVITHYDRDHVGGLSAVVGRVDRALIGPPDGAADERLLGQLEAGGADLVEAGRGLSGSVGRYRWSVLWPKPNTRLRGNDASVIVLFTGPLHMLFLGDLGEGAQDAVRGLGGIGRVDLVKVAHHGSADQSDRLYEQIAATAGLISVGADNTYGHPTPRLMGLLARTATQVFRTDRMGLVTVSERDGRMAVWSETRGPP